MKVLASLLTVSFGMKISLDCPFFDESGTQDQGQMTCNVGERISVESAIYGRSSSTECSAGNGTYEAWRYEVCDASHDVAWPRPCL